MAELIPSFGPMAEVMIEDPSGCLHPITSGPYLVVGCIHLEVDFQLFVVECPESGHRRVVDGVELIDVESWAANFRKGAS